MAGEAGGDRSGICLIGLRNFRRPLDIFGTVHIEERIIGLDRPFDGDARISSDEGGDSPLALLDKSAPQVVAQSHGPERHGVMGAIPGDGYRDPGACTLARVKKPLDKVHRQEWRVGGRADEIGALRPRRANVIHPRENARQGAGEALDAVGHDGQAQASEARRVAIRVDSESRALGRQALNDARDDRPPAKIEERLVASPHPAGEAAGEKNSDTLSHKMILRLPSSSSIYLMAEFRKMEPIMPSRRAFLAAALFVAATSAAWGAETPFSDAAFAAAQAAGKPVIVHVYAPWCPTCRAQEPILKKLEADPKFAGAEAFRVDFDHQKDAVKAFKARAQSTIIVFKGAKEVGRSVGETDEKAISALLDKAL